MHKQGQAYCRLGAELEGGWDRDPLDDGSGLKWCKSTELRLMGDGSVTAPGTHHRGEYVTTPQNTLAELLDVMRRGYPENVNETCGMHVHASFEAAEYNLLLDRRFYDYFLGRWEAWCDRVEKEKTAHVAPVDITRLRKRLKGDLQMNGVMVAQRAHNPEPQLYAAEKLGFRRGGGRYTHLNYCWRLRGTVECRLLPMFVDFLGAALAVTELISIYTDYLMNPGTPALEWASLVPEEPAIPATTVDDEILLNITGETLVLESEVPAVNLGRAPRGCFRIITLAKTPGEAVKWVSQLIKGVAVAEEED